MVGAFRLKTLEEECLRIIEERGALFNTANTGSHYLLSSGLHTDIFFQLARVFEHGPSRERLAELLLWRMRENGVSLREIDVLVGPAFGALPLMYTLQHFSDLAHTRVFFVERGQDGQFVLARGFSFTPDDRIFIVDDVVTTFRTIRESISALHQTCVDEEERSDAYIVGCAALIDRSPANLDLSVMAPTLKIVSGIRSSLSAYTRQECQFCKKGVKLVKP